MYTTTNYGFNIVEGTDIVNPLTQLNPNFTALDTDLKAVSDATVDHATCIKTGTVHAVTRTNTDAKVFRFTATGDWNTGDTMTVDGALVSVYATNGSAPTNGCYVINTEVIASIQGTRVTLYVNSADASNITCDDSNLTFTANNVQAAINGLSDSVKYASGTTVYSFPKSAAEIVGGNDEYTVSTDGVAFFKYVFGDSTYSQFNLFINNFNAFGSSITSGPNNLNGTSGVISFPIKAGDVIKVGFYSTYAMGSLSVRILSK